MACTTAVVWHRQPMQPLQRCRASWPWIQNAAVPTSKTKRQSKHFLELQKLLAEQSTGLQQSAAVKINPRAVHNAAALAYLGDAVYELYVRKHFLNPPQCMDKYNNSVTAVVCCEAQDCLLSDLLEGNFLSEIERDIVRWGKNVESGQNRATKRAGSAVYASASSLETLVGYLYLTDTSRLHQLMEKLGFINGL